MRPPFPFRIRSQQVWLSSESCLYWEDQQSLILSDLHFGKTGHFRKFGIPVPQAVYKEDLHRLLGQIQYFRPRQLIIVGDLFHSRANKEMDWFQKWRDNFPDLRILLIKGNHDILAADWYAACGIEVCDPDFREQDWYFIHDVSHKDQVPQEKEMGRDQLPGYCFSGHIHPGIRITGMGKQSLCFPCFYFGPHYALIPAFSRFTGVGLIQPQGDESVFAIVNGQIIPVN